MASLHLTGQRKLQVSVNKLLKEANSKRGTEKTRHHKTSPRNTQIDGAPDDITDTRLSNIVKSVSLLSYVVRLTGEPVFTSRETLKETPTCR